MTRLLKKNALTTIADIINIFGRIRVKILKCIFKSKFKMVGKNFEFSPHNSIFSYNSISIGDDVQIGSNCMLMASISEIKIGNKVLIAPGVTIRGGTHNIGVVGQYMFDVRHKEPIHDLGVIIDDDVWIGSNVTILHGVTISRGSVIGAGSVVTKSTKPYSISFGIPAKLYKFRFTKSQIIEHEVKLYPINKRLTENEIFEFYNFI